MAKMGVTSLYALLATVPLILAHELMHGFGGALFGHGAAINANGANPQGLDTTEQWVVFALSGTAYLFYVAVVSLLAFRKWRRLHWLGISLAAGTVHQLGFLYDFFYVVTTGTVAVGNGSDPFHAGAILWNNGPLSGSELPWREITFASGWPSFLIIAVLIATIGTWVCLFRDCAGMTANRRSVFPIVVTIFIAAATLSTVYAILARSVYEWTRWQWSASPAVILVLGMVLLVIPIINIDAWGLFSPRSA